MKIVVDMDPKDVWRIQEKAERLGVTPGEVLREELAVRRGGMLLRDRVRARVLAGMTDADIGIELGFPVGSIAQIRRGEGLPPNRNYRGGNKERKTA